MDCDTRRTQRAIDIRNIFISFNMHEMVYWHPEFFPDIFCPSDTCHLSLPSRDFSKAKVCSWAIFTVADVCF